MLSAVKKNPVVRKLAIERHRLRRQLSWHAATTKYAIERALIPLPYKTFSHKSLLLRKLGDADMRLQHNKVTNLRLAAQCINKIVIRPGETFSLWKLVGRPTAKRGFLPGMLLSNGDVTEGVGGGLCQMANLLYWMVLHSPLTVTERYHHSFDAFPDSGRVLPFGSGATIFYNYVDLQFRNDTPHAFELNVWVDDEYLQGELRCDTELPVSYSVQERDHQFTFDTKQNKYYRQNKLYRKLTDRKTGNLLDEQFLYANYSEMKYQPPIGVHITTI